MHPCLKRISNEFFWKLWFLLRWSKSSNFPALNISFLQGTQMALCTDLLNVLGIWHDDLLMHVLEIGACSLFHIRQPLVNPFTASQQALLTLFAKQLEPSAICHYSRASIGIYVWSQHSRATSNLIWRKWALRHTCKCASSHARLRSAMDSSFAFCRNLPCWSMTSSSSNTRGSILTDSALRASWSVSGKKPACPGSFHKTRLITNWAAWWII